MVHSHRRNSLTLGGKSMKSAGSLEACRIQSYLVVKLWPTYLSMFGPFPLLLPRSRRTWYAGITSKWIASGSCPRNHMRIAVSNWHTKASRRVMVITSPAFLAAKLKALTVFLLRLSSRLPICCDRRIVSHNLIPWQSAAPVSAYLAGGFRGEKTSAAVRPYKT
jgi:hypothetical protein